MPRRARAELGRRYIELLSENLGQPGFRELLVTVHDMDARRDVVFALLGRAAPGALLRAGRRAAEDAARGLEAFDLAGVARDHAFDALAAALALPVATEPHLATFAAEGPWRGETHRLCDRPGSLEPPASTRLRRPAPSRSFSCRAASPAGTAARAEHRRAPICAAAPANSSARSRPPISRDVLDASTGRFAGLFVIRPPHNPLGPLDFAGVYDERSDRVQSLAELLDRGYEDAYRQFIEPVVGARRRTRSRSNLAMAATAEGWRCQAHLNFGELS